MKFSLTVGSLILALYGCKPATAPDQPDFDSEGNFYRKMPKVAPQDAEFDGSSMSEFENPAEQETFDESSLGIDLSNDESVIAGSGAAALVDLNAKLPIRVQGRQLLVDGKPFIIKGVCYNPVRRTGTHPSGLLTNAPSATDLVIIERDFTLMKAAGINTIRTYVPFTNPQVLALLNKHQLFVIVPVLNWYLTSLDEMRNTVNTLKNHRSTLMWELGNEWNYNSLYANGAGGFGYEQTKLKIKATVAMIRNNDLTHPISSSYGDLPPKAITDEFVNIAIWGLNVYAGKSFWDRFTKWKAQSGKPMYVAEFGADAINRNVKDLPAQAVAIESLLNELKANLSANNAANASLGGTAFEWVDEWWKDPNGKIGVQDMGGIAPGSGPWPDAVFNEEWFGFVNVDRGTRPAYEKLKAAWRP